MSGVRLRVIGQVMPASYLRTIVWRALVLWLLVRLVRLVVSAYGALSVGLTLAMSPLASLVLAGIVAALADVDARAMREPLFYASLGTPAWLPAALAGLCALVVEALITMAVVIA